MFDAAERLAEELHISRSQLYAQALAAFLEKKGASAVTAKLNQVYGAESGQVEDALHQAQMSSVGHEAW